MVFGRLRPCSHFTGSIIGAPRKPYRTGLLFTFDHAGLAQFLWQLRAGTLRFQKWYVPYRIAFWNASLVVWTGKTLRIGPIFEKESRYHFLGLEARFLLPNESKYETYRSGIVWTAQLQTGTIWFDFSESTVHIVSDRFLNWTVPKIDLV